MTTKKTEKGTNINLGIGSPITEFIQQTRVQTISGLGDWEIKKPIKLELSTVVTGKIGGGIDIQVLKLGADVQAQQVHKIELEIGPKDEVQQAENKARIARAKYEESRASDGIYDPKHKSTF